MSMTEALEMMSCRSRSSSPEVHAFALFNFFVSASPGPGVGTENLIRIYQVTESAKVAR
jgi:hypothetical protein